jgi:mono/diheme cytochrome c family protein
MTRSFALIVCALSLGLLETTASAVRQQTPPAAPATAGSEAASRAVFDKYCVRCHSTRLHTANLSLEAMDLAQVSEHADTWEKVVRKLRTAAMPPPNGPRPTKAEYDATAGWLEGELDRAAAAHPNPGSPTLHRLNRTEYHNAIRDLFGIDVDAEALLPSDNAAYGFDNMASALSLSPILTERYLGAAVRVTQTVLATVRGTPSPDTFLTHDDLDQRDRVSGDLPLGSRGGIAVRYYFPVDAEYQFKMELGELGLGGAIGINAEPNQLDVRIDDGKVWTTTIGGDAVAKSRVPSIIVSQQVQEGLQFRAPVKAGSHLVQVAFARKTDAMLEDVLSPKFRSRNFRHDQSGEPEISSLAISGPWGAPNGTVSDDSPSRRRLLTCRPMGADPQDAACARRIIGDLARRAYRRPVTEADLQDPMSLYREGAKRGGFDAGLDLAIRGILVSPEFLFRFESQPDRAVVNTPYHISDLDLASRLSFFLWSTIPDDQLMNAAARGTLGQPAVLKQQVERMLADPRSQALVDNFGGQWLHIRNVPGLRPSPELLFHFDDNLRQAFARETQLFFGSIISENRSVLDLLDADYTFLNERLARHYGIPGVYGDQFRRVSLPLDSPRRGLLGQGSILTDTSRANRTSVVIRGKWILDNIFGTPPPPPPPNVPALPEPSEQDQPHTLRQLMETHRKNPVCASCHTQMDQLGFALENFDAIGEWRDKDASGLPIDASGLLPDGTKFNGPIELRKVLLARSDSFVTTLTENLLTYALGRGLDFNDEPAVRRIKREAADSNYRFESLVLAIVKSTPFEMRIAQDRSN